MFYILGKFRIYININRKENPNIRHRYQLSQGVWLPKYLFLMRWIVVLFSCTKSHQSRYVTTRWRIILSEVKNDSNALPALAPISSARWAANIAFISNGWFYIPHYINQHPHRNLNSMNHPNRKWAYNSKGVHYHYNFSVRLILKFKRFRKEKSALPNFDNKSVSLPFLPLRNKTSPL